MFLKFLIRSLHFLRVFNRNQRILNQHIFGHLNHQSKMMQLSSLFYFLSSDSRVWQEILVSKIFKYNPSIIHPILKIGFIYFGDLILSAFIIFSLTFFHLSKISDVIKKQLKEFLIPHSSHLSSNPHDKVKTQKTCTHHTNSTTRNEHTTNYFYYYYYSL